ncbi:bifunctional diaminohydroxyphosphoribosylaminopyrimidine deaminase/5-amino-6-(5-phosphoribosylamino)uracil reductase RibD, partial [Salmonella enterica subsp. enterica serovar Enteritidis]|nr:bifunctional diaminohydroxyphosphoribosylaminopyrimidine deaminase/5-amino-6-(5-phosphoribosylamino)uracil reductase RibD [Salmonella enterica subsp. enterica serovar Enteritidis]
MTANLSSAERYQHQYYMSRAIELAKKGRFTTRPNPNVGCVIVKDNQIIGEGFHYQAGQPHAEVFALREAYEHDAKQLQGATAYVTLEPCSHHGRTPPCADALIKAGINRVVIAVVDPNPKVDGGGIAKLQQADIEVITGICEQAAYQLNEGFFKVMRGGLPFVRLKIAT